MREVKELRPSKSIKLCSEAMQVYIYKGKALPVACPHWGRHLAQFPRNDSFSKGWSLVVIRHKLTEEFPAI